MISYKSHYEEYQKMFQKKKASSNSNKVSLKETNTKTNKYNKSFHKVDDKANTIISFSYENNNNNMIPEYTNQENKNTNEVEEINAFNLKKRKMLIPKIKIKIDKKVFYKKDGRTEQFNLYQERDIGLNKYDNQIDIMPSEEDYDSDNMIIMDGKKKAEKDLIEAVDIIKRNNLEEVSNYVKYCKQNIIKGFSSELFPKENKTKHF